MTIVCLECGHNVPEGKEICIYCGAAQGEGVTNAESEIDTIGEDIRWTFSPNRARRPFQLSPMIQALIFLLSAAIGGFLVFLMG
jgi:hypothetical protein